MLHAIGYLILGGLAGIVGGHLMSGRAFGPLVDLLLGIVGGLVAGLIFGALFNPVPLSGVGEALTVIFAACLVVAILHLVVRRGRLQAE